MANGLLALPLQLILAVYLRTSRLRLGILLVPAATMIALYFQDYLAPLGLGSQAEQASEPARLRELLDVNFVSAALWREAVAGQMEAQGFGRLGILGSVAGDRGRQSNYLYGATKSALERVAEGIAHRFARAPKISVTLIKPGFIDTPMTAHLPKSGPLLASPEKVADIIWRAMQARRVRVYAPWFWRNVLLIVRALPVQVMHLTKT